MNADLAALPDGVRVDLESQRRALTDRVESSGLYRHEIHEFGIAGAALACLWPRLGIDEDLGSLTTPESRNIVRRVRLRDGSHAVLKLIGNTREPGEGDLLAAWRRAKLPCVEPVTWGYLQVRTGSAPAGVPRTATYLLTRLVPARYLPEPSGLDEQSRRASDLVALVRPFHAADVRVPRTRSWSDRLGQHLRETLPLLRRHGLPEPEQWTDKLDRLSRDGRVTVHGDPAGRNVLDSGHGLILLDPPGAITALPEADVAQICCQVGGADGVRALLALVAEQEPQLDPSAVSGFAGLNLLVWAGYAAAEHSNPDIDHDDASGVAKAHRYLRIAAELLAEFPLA